MCPDPKAQSVYAPFQRFAGPANIALSGAAFGRSRQADAGNGRATVIGPILSGVDQFDQILLYNSRQMYS